MENKNKMAFFALYWGQEVMLEVGKHKINRYRVGYLDDNKEDHYLELKPLSSISDEDAIKICEIHFIQQGIDFKRENIDSIKIVASQIPSKCNSICIEVIYNHSWGKELERIFIDSNRKTNSAIVDKIRELGFAFSFNMLSVEKQIEYGWIKFN